MGEANSDSPPFIFITGAAGSGTTLLSQVLAGVQDVVCVGGKFHSFDKQEVEAVRLVRRINAVTEQFWDRSADSDTASAAQREFVDLIKQATALPGRKNPRRVVYKRSSPFLRGDRYRPDLLDLPAMFGDWRLLLIVREAQASAASAKRRGFGDNLRHCAMMTAEHLTHLAAQFSVLPPERCLAIGYEQFCEDPAVWSQPLAEVCDLSEADVTHAIAKQSIRTNRAEAWRDDLSQADLQLLDQFFTDRRRRQWRALEIAAQPTQLVTTPRERAL